MKSIDLNCDLGESFGAYKLGRDEEMLEHVSSVNIACGFHAGDPVVMGKTVKLALEKGIAIGAHPGFPDLMGFGRRNMTITLEEARCYMIYQVGALKAFVEAEGGRLVHVKPHGALYNMAAKDYKLARALAEAVYAIDQELYFVGLSGSEMIRAAEDIGLRPLSEVFADRGYNSDGSLVDRRLEGAMIEDEAMCVKRVIGMATEGAVLSIDGKEFQIKADTVCLHGDGPKAVEFARGLRLKLLSHSVKIVSFAGGR